MPSSRFTRISWADAGSDRQAWQGYEKMESLGNHEGQGRAVPADNALDPGLEKSRLEEASLGFPSLRSKSNKGKGEEFREMPTFLRLGCLTESAFIEIWCYFSYLLLSAAQRAFIIYRWSLMLGLLQLKGSSSCTLFLKIHCLLPLNCTTHIKGWQELQPRSCWFQLRRRVQPGPTQPGWVYRRSQHQR